MFKIVRQDTRLQFDKLTANRLLHDVFGFGANNTIPEAASKAGFHHWDQVLHQNDNLLDHNPALGATRPPLEDICELIAVLKQNTDKTIQQLHTQLQSQPLAWIPDATDEVKVDNALHFAIYLWLFTRPDLKDKTKTLKEVVQESLASVTGASSAWLWLDFSAATLRKRAGFRFEFTSDLGDHLTFVSRDVIRVFAQTSVLDQYNDAGAIERSLYPDGMLEEFQKTMNLLWPFEDAQTQKRAKRLQEKKCVDLEAGPGDLRNEEKYNLRKYPIFGVRLAKIQDRLEVEEQQKTNTTAFMIAVWGIVLTAFFGLISAVTGIVSMWAGLKQVGAV